MAGLADDWHDHRQTCIDVLCAYLRMHYDPKPPDDPTELQKWHGERQVRHTVIRVITAHLRDNAPKHWRGHDFDFTGAVFDGGDFSRATFSDGTVGFSHATFSDGTVGFSYATFSDGTVDLANPRSWEVAPVFGSGLEVAPPAGLLLPQTTPQPPPDRATSHD